MEYYTVAERNKRELMYHYQWCNVDQNSKFAKSIHIVWCCLYKNLKQSKQLFILYRDTYINMKIYGNAWNVKFQVIASTYLRRAKILGRTQGGMLMSPVFYILSCLVDTQVHVSYALYFVIF